MPFVFIIIGLTLLISGVRDTQDALFTLLQNDFQGQQSFIPWIVAILIIGMLGYIETIKPISRSFLVLLILVLFLSNGGFFSKFSAALAPYSTQGVKTT
jgi:membrane-bound acyltransferase YfiQ involved in biofilm formation